MSLQASELFSALGHETRLRCLMLLTRQGELCVCELTHATALSQPHVSRHLAQLRELGLVADRREGIWVYYRINPVLPDWVHRILRTAAEGIGRQLPFVDDECQLKAMPNRPGAAGCA